MESRFILGDLTEVTSCLMRQPIGAPSAPILRCAEAAPMKALSMPARSLRFPLGSRDG